MLHSSDLPMRRLLAALASLLFSGCASMPDFQSDWLDRLPTQRVELAVFVYPLQDARPFARLFPTSIQQSDATRIESAVNRHLVAALRSRGLDVGSTLLALRSEHVWLWDWTKGPGSEPTVNPLFASSSPAHAQRVSSYIGKLRGQMSSHPGSTALIVCVAAHLNNRDGNVEYRTPVYMHFGGGEGISTERCGTTAAVAAVNDQLRLIAYSPLYTGHGVEVLGQSANPLSTAFTFRRLSPDEWGEKMAKAILKRIRAVP